MPSVFERVPNVHGRGVTYYAQAIDTDSHRPALVKVWDTDEIPDYVLLYLLYDWACAKTAGAMRAVLNIPGPNAHKPFKPKGLQI